MDADYREVCKRLAARRGYYYRFLYTAHDLLTDSEVNPVDGIRVFLPPSLCTSDLNQYLKASSTNGSTA